MIASRVAAALAAVAGILLAAAAVRADDGANPATVCVGLTRGLALDFPGATSGRSDPGSSAAVRRLVEERTGIAARFTGALDQEHLGRMLIDGDVQLGLFHGVEFAWAKQKYPDLKPLLVLVNETPFLRACLLVRRDSGITDFADLKGKSCALPATSRQHCRLFLEARCRQLGAEPKAFFSRLDAPANVGDAIEEVVEGAVQAVVVEEKAAECFRRLKPGRFARLEIVQRSEVSPAAVLAYADGRLDGATRQYVRDSLLRAAHHPRSRAFLLVCRLTGLEDVPEGYDQVVRDIAAAYQPPARPAVFDWLTAGLSGLNTPAKKPAEVTVTGAPDGGR